MKKKEQGPSGQRTKPKELLEDIKLYDQVGQRNGTFLFEWLHNIYSRVYLPCIDLTFKETLSLDKTRLTIFDVLVDDLADNFELRNWEALTEFVKIPWEGGNSYANEYSKIGKKIWDRSIRSIRKYPRFKELKKVFYFDLGQVMSSMEYSYLVNSYRLDNPIEEKIYPPHGCMVILHCDMDLMCSPEFDLKELRAMRVIFNLAQRVSHIGNMLNTYPKEIEEKDYSSPIISRGLRRGLLKDMKNGEILAKLKPLEKEFKDEALAIVKDIRVQEEKIESVDMKGFSDSLRKTFNNFLKRDHYWERN